MPFNEEVDGDNRARMPGTPSVQDTVASRSNNTLDLVTAHTIERIDKLITALTELKALVIDDCARTKLELQAHINVATAASERTGAIEEWLIHTRKDRSRALNIRTIDHGD